MTDKTKYANRYELHTSVPIHKLQEKTGLSESSVKSYLSIEDCRIIPAYRSSQKWALGNSEKHTKNYQQKQISTM